MAWIYEITSSTPSWSNTKDDPTVINNTWEFYNYFNGYMTIEAMAGILGNMRHESAGINPGQMEIGYGGDPAHGYGLIQWTPSTDLTDYVSGNWYDGNVQCDLIQREGENISPVNGRWIPTSAYPYTWAQFCQLTNVEEATKAYLYERERGTSVINLRVGYALEEYEILGGTPPTPTPGISLLIALLKPNEFWR